LSQGRPALAAVARRKAIPRHPTRQAATPATATTLPATTTPAAYGPTTHPTTAHALAARGPAPSTKREVFCHKALRPARLLRPLCAAARARPAALLLLLVPTGLATRARSGSTLSPTTPALATTTP